MDFEGDMSKLFRTKKQNQKMHYELPQALLIQTIKKLTVDMSYMSCIYDLNFHNSI